MHQRLISFFLVLSAGMYLLAQDYTPQWESLDSRPVPGWFEDAKFGIIVHWGIYSVPAYRNFYQEKQGTYAEWYAPDVMYKPWRNNNFHARNYGEDFTYRDFAGLFRAELWDPDRWARTFAASGARYVVFTAKHHDGYCMWPTQDRFSRGWNCMDTGPKRDLTGELARACRQNGLKFGIYYSLLEWESTKTRWPFDETLAAERTGYYIPMDIWEKRHIPDSLFVDHLHFQLKELVRNYHPSLIFADGAWDQPDTYWKSTDFLAWLYNSAPNKREVVVNDRWGNNTTGVHGDYYTTEYIGPGSARVHHPWEECRGMGYSFGYNRAENIEDISTSRELVEILCRVVCNGGNLLLNVGPAADGRIHYAWRHEQRA